MGGVVVLAQTYLLTGPYEEILWERTFKYRGHWPPSPGEGHRGFCSATSTSFCKNLHNLKQIHISKFRFTFH